MRSMRVRFQRRQGPEGRSVFSWAWRVGVGAGVTVGLAICLIASHAWGQEPRPGGTREQPPEPGPSPTTPSPGPPPAAYPLELLGLLAPPPQRGGVTLTPSISVSEEYNDNIFLNNQTRQWDLITGVTPAMTLYVNRRSYRLSGGVSFTGELYQRETRFNDAFKSQNFVANGFYQAAPQLALTAFDSFARGRNTSLVASQSFATGRQESWSNTFVMPGPKVLLHRSTGIVEQHLRARHDVADDPAELPGSRRDL